MRLTTAVSAIAVASFTATFALAPYAQDLGQRLDFKQILTVPVTVPDKKPVAATQAPDCNAPFGKVLAALAAKECEK